MTLARMFGLAALIAGAGHAPLAAAGLTEFLATPDPAFEYSVASAYRAEDTTVYNVHMTSQVWSGEPWRHWVTLIVPDELRQRQTALLVIGGGVVEPVPAPGLTQAGRTLLDLAKATGSIAAMVEQVPNQPLFGGKVEDEIIALTFDEYFEQGDETRLLLFPMVRSAVAAMDAVQGIALRHAGAALSGFVVAGASKRGWTTYLTAAVDTRVRAMAPMVIDMLNMPEQIRRQRWTYGGFSEQISEYTERGLQERMESDEGEALLARVDPYRYRHALTMPKLVLLGTNDPFWTVDAASVYWPELPGPKWLHYEANAGHGLGRPTVRTLAAFYAAMTSSAMLPTLTWERDGNELAVTWSEGDGQAYLWSAWSGDRDFREAEWSHEALEGAGRAVASLDAPAEGWRAWYIEVRFPRGPLGVYGLTTEIVVLPSVFPHQGP